MKNGFVGRLQRQINSNAIMAEEAVDRNNLKNGIIDHPLSEDQNSNSNSNSNAISVEIHASIDKEINENPEGDGDSSLNTQLAALTTNDEAEVVAFVAVKDASDEPSASNSEPTDGNADPNNLPNGTAEPVDGDEDAKAPLPDNDNAEIINCEEERNSNSRLSNRNSYRRSVSTSSSSSSSSSSLASSLDYCCPCCGHSVCCCICSCCRCLPPRCMSGITRCINGCAKRLIRFVFERQH